MRSIDFTRPGDLSVADHLQAMRAWLGDEGIRVVDLRALRILASRITFRITFENDIDADRFGEKFLDQDQT